VEVFDPASTRDIKNNTYKMCWNNAVLTVAIGKKNPVRMVFGNWPDVHLERLRKNTKNAKSGESANPAVNTPGTRLYRHFANILGLAEYLCIVAINQSPLVRSRLSVLSS
jgi:hypothetical protein